MENIIYKPLTYEEIVLSGSFARKIYHSYLKQFKQNPDFKVRYKHKEIIYNGPSNIIEEIEARSTYLTNNYLKNIIDNVEDEEYRKQIIKFSQNENSRNSLFHIFNIELLCFSANFKPERFQFIMNCVTDSYVLTHDTDNYPFYLFAILDAEDIETANDIYDKMMERTETKSIAVSEFYSYVARKLSANELKLVQENIDKLQII